jgi:hypothetical protein
LRRCRIRRDIDGHCYRRVACTAGKRVASCANIGRVWVAASPARARHGHEGKPVGSCLSNRNPARAGSIHSKTHGVRAQVVAVRTGRPDITPCVADTQPKLHSSSWNVKRLLGSRAVSSQAIPDEEHLVKLWGKRGKGGTESGTREVQRSGRGTCWPACRNKKANQVTCAGRHHARNAGRPGVRGNRRHCPYTIRIVSVVSGAIVQDDATLGRRTSSRDGACNAVERN